MSASATATTERAHRVFVIDDHPLMRAGMAKVVGMEPDLHLCGELGSGRGSVDVLLREQPDVILLDLSLQDCSGLELIKDYRAAGIESAILVVSMHDEALYADRALRAGANGYLMKEEVTKRVVEGIRSVLRGEIFLSDPMQRLMLKRMAGRDKPLHDGLSLDRLTDREFEVFELIGKGMPSRQVAENLGISPKTVDAHRTHIKEKLGFTDGAAMVRYAVRWVETGPRGQATPESE